MHIFCQWRNRRRPDKAPAPPSGVAENERPILPDGAALIRPTMLSRRPDKAPAPPSGVAESERQILPDGAALIRPTMLRRRPDKALAPPSGVAESGRPILPDGASLIRPTMLNSRQQKASPWAGFSELVGDRGFEPPTPSSRTKCATRLRQSPNAGRILLLRCAPVNPLV